jgi:hypothetical protein
MPSGVFARADGEAANHSPEAAARLLLLHEGFPELLLPWRELAREPGRATVAEAHRAGRAGDVRAVGQMNDEAEAGAHLGEHGRRRAEPGEGHLVGRRLELARRQLQPEPQVDRVAWVTAGADHDLRKT